MWNFKEIRSQTMESMWFVPSIIVSASIGVALLFIYIDQTYPFTIGGKVFGFFGGRADAARGLLATIAGSVITVISIAFSITFVALQQASSQYSPRVLRTFTSNRRNQIVLGTYLATFLYSLLVLRSIRSGEDTEFVPALSVTAAIFFALICIGLLILFINQAASSLQSENIVGDIHSELVKRIKSLYPETMGDAVDSEFTGHELFQKITQSGYIDIIGSQRSGFLRLVDHDVLSRFKAKNVQAVFVMPRIGDYIGIGQPLFKVSRQNGGPDYDPDQLRSALGIGYPRTLEQDPLFAVRMLVDVSLKALSPSMNDPTTAEYCLLHLTDALCMLAERKFPETERKFENNRITFFFNAPEWYTYLYEAFSQPGRAAARSFHVTYVLLDQIARLAWCVPNGGRSKAVLRILNEIEEAFEANSFSESNLKVLQAKAAEVKEILQQEKTGQ